jgi:TfoX/Sxy family transcriptional regulator of competence genes
MTPLPGGSRPQDAVDRVRALLPGRQLREVRMFGAVAVMVDGDMAVAVHGDGSLLVRVDPADDGRLLESPDASRAVMGKSRSMGVGWIRVEARAVSDDGALAGWVGAATRYLDQRQQGRGAAERSAHV